MKFDVIKGILGEIAPTIGTALGGPVGGAAASMLADVLGCDPTPQKIEKALAQATPEQLAEIKKAELDFEVRMKELEVDVFALETKDIQHARDSFQEDWDCASHCTYFCCALWRIYSFSNSSTARCE